jgi:5-methylcytosine-specific restriction endonuclease McrA
MAVEQPTTKTCTKCAETKPVSGFNIARHHKDGLTSHCKACCNAWHKEHHKSVRERLKPIRRQWYLKNKLEHNKRSLAGYYANTQEWQERNRLWAKANPQKMRMYVRVSDARRRRAPGKFSKQDIENLLVLQKQQCAACKKRLVKYHVDHIAPIAKGGTNDKSNIQLLCQSCNQRKHTKDFVVFMQEMGYLL